jgi:hypothetical protein
MSRRKNQRRKVFRLIVEPAEEEDDDVQDEDTATKPATGQGPHRNAYFASAAYRGLPSPPHGGSRTVSPDQILGTLGGCWCGLPWAHDWPGKDAGRPHPRTEAQRRQQEQQQQEEEGMTPELVITRRDLRAYHRDLQDLVMTATSKLGCTFRLGRNNLILYPPDGSPPYTVHARNNPRQVQSFKLWLDRHAQPEAVYPYTDEQGKVLYEVMQYPDRSADQSAPPEALAELATQVNDPVEHPTKARQEPEDRPQQPASPSAGETPTSAPPAPQRATQQSGWREYLTRDESQPTGFETNGHLYRCIECLGTPREYVANNPRGIGGHNRMHHRDTSNLRGPEARAKATETRRLNKMTEQVEQAYATLGTALGVSTHNDALNQRIAELEASIVVLKAQRDSEAEARAEAESKLALMREAFEGLS